MRNKKLARRIANGLGRPTFSLELAKLTHNVMQAKLCDEYPYHDEYDPSSWHDAIYEARDYGHSIRAYCDNDSKFVVDMTHLLSAEGREQTKAYENIYSKDGSWGYTEMEVDDYDEMLKKLVSIGIYLSQEYFVKLLVLDGSPKGYICQEILALNVCNNVEKVCTKLKPSYTNYLPMLFVYSCVDGVAAWVEGKLDI